MPQVLWKKLPRRCWHFTALLDDCLVGEGLASVLKDAFMNSKRWRSTKLLPVKATNLNVVEQPRCRPCVYYCSMSTSSKFQEHERCSTIQEACHKSAFFGVKRCQSSYTSVVTDHLENRSSGERVSASESTQNWLTSLLILKLGRNLEVSQPFAQCFLPIHYPHAVQYIALRRGCWRILWHVSEHIASDTAKCYKWSHKLKRCWTINSDYWTFPHFVIVSDGSAKPISRLKNRKLPTQKS